MIKNNALKIAVASGKGGTGKTLVSTSLFYTLMQNNHHVTLIDCDAEEPNAKAFFKTSPVNCFSVTQKVPVIDPNACTFCGKCHEYCNYNAIFILPPMKIIHVIEELCHDCGACSVACQYGAITEKSVSLGNVNMFKVNGSSTLVEGYMNVGVYSPVPVIKRAIKEADNKYITIMDSPPGTSCPFIQTVAHADFVILVTEPTPFGLSDLKQAVETLKTMKKDCGVIVNRAELGDREVYKYLKEENIPLLLEIPFDKEIAMIYSVGHLLAEEKKEWQEKFNTMFDYILEKYGNSSN